MKLTNSSWLEVEDYLRYSDGVILPTGSIEQHGPIGLIGTDMLCVDTISTKVGEELNALVAPPLGYAPAEFNMAFPGTISLSLDLYKEICSEIFSSLTRHGFGHIYVLNGHGANLEPLRELAKEFTNVSIRIKSWWEFLAVNKLRNNFYSDWEGMDATPSEISITQAYHRIISSPLASEPPEKLSKEYIIAHSGDRHEGPEKHKASFPDGRVGSHSALAKPEHGVALTEAAVLEIKQDYLDFLRV